MALDLRVLGACGLALAATPARLLRPRRPDRRLLARLDEARTEPPRASRTVHVTPLVQSRQHAPTMVVAEGVFQPPRVEIGMTAFLVEHPDARFLVDPALCADVHHGAVAELPPPFRWLVAPQKPVTALRTALDRIGLAPTDIEFALPTHLHWDHVSGLAELPDEIPVRTLAVERTFALGTTRAPLGVARGPLRDKNFEHYELDGPPVLAFERSHDVFGDGSVVLVDLAGHTPGSVGVLLAVEGGRRVLLAGDAVWHRMQIQLLRETAPLPGELVDADRDASFGTLHRLHALPGDIEVVPAHDHAATAALARP